MSQHWGGYKGALELEEGGCERRRRKGQSLLRGPAGHTLSSGSNFLAFSDEALPFYFFALQLAVRFCGLIADAIVQEITDCNYCQHDSYHGAPSFWLSLNIDAQIASQMFIGVLTLKIGFTGICMAFVAVVKVLLNFIVFHRITSLVCRFGFSFVVSFDPNIRHCREVAI